MPPNLRLSLTIFSIGFAIESGVDIYHLVTGSTALVAGGSLFLIGGIATAAGLLFLFLGRHEWNEVHHDRVRHAHLAFAAVLALGAAAVAPPAYYATRSSATLPFWVGPEVGAAIALALVISIVLYDLVVFHLVATAGKALLVIATLAAAPVAYVIGSTVAANLPNYLDTVRGTPGALIVLVGPVVQLLSWLFACYLLLLIAFTDAHRRVARGLAVDA